ncbi:DUF4189 domain-containing protein [Solilutibacter pythonis]
MATLFGFSSYLVAQAPPSGPCPPGAVPIPGQGRCGSPAEAAGINRGGSGSSTPAYTEIWEDRYGAIAVDYISAKSGTVENEKSERRAKDKALKLCGTSNCKIMTSVRNYCQAAAYGGGVSYGTASTIGEARNIAMARCQSDGRQCEIQYSGCSLPVRVK